MDKNIKDYLHLYLGCEVMAGTHRCKLIGVQENGAIVISSIGERHIIIFPNVKPILRPLSDMTEKEKIFGDLHSSPPFEPDEFLYLLKQGFDLFGLIDAGIAIDKTKLPANA